MATRAIDGPCPVCNADKNAIHKEIRTVNGSPMDFYICVVCGYDESQSAKFPSHQE